MIAHYLKIAWRNLLKYRMQSVVSILGLAVGLACFALSAFWIHYEMTYDTFHRDADRLYLVGVNDDSFGGASASFTPYALGRYLKEHYSEIVWGIERNGFFNGRGKWVKGFENQRV